MPNSFENPFIPKPDNLKPDSAEFLQKYAGASKDQLKKARISGEGIAQELDSVESANTLKQTTDKEKEAYLNEEVSLDSVAIKRADALRIQNILKKLNQQRQADGQPEVILGQEIKLDRAQIGGQTKEQLKQELKKSKIKTSKYANALLNSHEFEPLKEPEDTVLIKLTVGDLGFPNGATTEAIYQRAQELGLDLCPAETGPQLRTKPDTEQKLGEHFNIAMKQISDSFGDPGVFYLYRPDEPWLHANIAEPDERWHADNLFVFRLRPVKSRSDHGVGNSQEK